MSRFVECSDGRLINVAHIVRVEPGWKRNDDCILLLDDGKSLEAPRYVCDQIAGSRYITQIISCDGKYEIVYSDTIGENGGKPWVYDCEYLAVCADGAIRALEHTGNYFEFADDSSNYVGFRPKEKAGETR